MGEKSTLYFWSALLFLTFLTLASIVPVSGNTPVDPYGQYECAWKCDYDLQIGDKFYPIGYGLKGERYGEPNSVRLISIKADIEQKSIIANIETEGSGTFQAFLPRYVIQSANDMAETDFTVLINGKEVLFVEDKDAPAEPFKYRTLTIGFDKGSKKIEIIGTWINDGKDFSDPNPYFSCGSFEQNCTYMLQAAGNNKTLPLRYAILGNEKTGDKEFPKVEKIYVYTISDSLFFYVESPHQGGHLALELPPETFQFAYGSDFFVSGGVNHTNIVRKDAQLLDIQFGKGSHEIEISGISLFKEGEKVVPPPDFPCAVNDCIYNDVAGAAGATYDVMYHVYGWPNFGYPDTVRINEMSIDSNNKSLVVNVTAEQRGRMDIILEEELMANELAGNEGINYIVYVDDKRMDTSWPGSNYFPDKNERIASFDVPRGAEQVEIVGVPVERCDERGYGELAFCLYEININGNLYPLLIRYSPDLSTNPSVNASLSINNVSVDEQRKSIIFDLTATHGGSVHFIPTKEMIDAEDYLQAHVNGKIDSGSDNLEGQINVWFFVPAGSSKVELLGTWVTPEFGSIAAIVMAIALAGIVMAARRLSRSQMK